MSHPTAEPRDGSPDDANDDTSDTGVAPESPVEGVKRASRHLRGTIAESLASDATHFGGDDAQLLKFHGTYQQDDRDRRRALERAGEEKAWRFMVRVALPAGTLTAEQYLGFDDLAERHADGTLRITTRQGFQFHGIVKSELKATIAGINAHVASTLAACGDVNRNVMGCAAPLAGPVHEALRRLAADVADALRPASRAYHEIWLDGERVTPTVDEEPFYGERYLPRKFKIAVASTLDNCVDVWAQDVGLLAVVEDDRILGYNLLVGGGLGMTHNKGDTFARLAEPLAFVPVEGAVEAARAVAAVFRDHGDRTNRKHARLKYVLTEWGIERFREEWARHVSFAVRPPLDLPRIPFTDHLGAHAQGDGESFVGVFVQSGRIRDTPEQPLRTALRRIVARYRPSLTLTAHQSLLLTGLDEATAAAIVRELAEAGVVAGPGLSAVRRYSLACPALPTCGLAVAESERAIPGVLDALESELDALGLRDVPLTVRMTGCPNGCARPYTADLAFVGRSLGLYQVYVGGGLAGDRIADLFQAQVKQADLVPAVRPLLARWASERRDDEGLGDFYQRVVGHATPRRQLTGRELPTAPLLAVSATPDGAVA
jgi:sulfite reductase (ferredoxin)